MWRDSHLGRELRNRDSRRFRALRNSRMITTKGMPVPEADPRPSMRSATSQASIRKSCAIAPLPAKRQVDHYLITVNVVTVNPFTFEFVPSLISSKET